MPPASGKFLISGASGMLGSAIRRELAASELEIVRLVRSARTSVGPHGEVRPSTPAPPVFRSVAVSLSGEISWNPAATPTVAYPELLEGFTAAIHLAGANLAAHRWTAAYKREIASSRVDSTRALATTLAALRNPPPTLLIASATGIYGDRGAEMLDESSSPGSGFLADLCHQWEAAAQPAVDAGIRVVHLRFGVALGPKTTPGALARMVPIFRLGLGGRLGSGRQWMSWISLPDLVSAVLFLLDRPTLAGPVNLTAPNPVSNAQFTHALARELHRPALLPVPAAGLRLIFGEMADEALLASARAFPSKLSASGFQFAHPTIDLALAAVLAKR